MKYKRVVGYGANEQFVIFELKNGMYAVVGCNGSKEVLYYGSWLSAAKFVPVYVTNDVPHEMLREAAHVLEVTEEGGNGYEATLAKLEGGGFNELRKETEKIEQEVRDSGEPVIW